MLAFRWRWSVAKNSAGFALARYKIPLALVLHYKISAGAGANADQRTRPILVWMDYGFYRFKIQKSIVHGFFQLIWNVLPRSMIQSDLKSIWIMDSLCNRYGFRILKYMDHCNGYGLWNGNGFVFKSIRTH